MSSLDTDEWIMKNFRAVRQALEVSISENNLRQTEIKELREAITMVVQDNKVLTQRINLLLADKVLGRTDGS